MECEVQEPDACILDGSSPTAAFLFTMYQAQLHASFITFQNARATNGGAIYLNGGASELSLVKCKFINNVATELGGAIAAYIGAVRLVDVDFIGNEAGCGGALWANSLGQANVFISGGSFVNNIGRSGGGLCIQSTKIFLDNVAFRNNTASIGFGGGIYLQAGGSADITGGLFSENKALEGGGILVLGSNGVNSVVAKKVTFVNNEAETVSTFIAVSDTSGNSLFLIKMCSHFSSPLLLSLVERCGRTTK